LFNKKGTASQIADRIPPGQRNSSGWPVLDLGRKPEMDLNDWTLTVVHKGQKKEFTLNNLKALGESPYTTDFHCVTTWSKLDMKWTGITFAKLVKACSDILTDDSWKFLIQTGKDGYTTNSPREDLEHEDVILAYEWEKKPISKEHGYIRIIIPHLYGWKSCKFLKKIEFVETDQPGYWENRGYSNRGNVWNEERFHDSEF